MKKLLIIVVLLFTINCPVYSGSGDDIIQLPDLEFKSPSKKFLSENSAYKVDNLIKSCLYAGKIRTYGVESPAITYVIKDGRARVKKATNVNTSDIRLINRRIKMFVFPECPVMSFKTIYSMK